MEQQQGEQTDLRSVIKVLWRRKWLLLGIIVSIPVLVYAVSTQISKTYEATTLLRLKTTNVEVSGQTSFGTSPLSTASTLIGTTNVREETARELGRQPEGDVSATPIEGASGELTDLLALKVEADSANGAAAEANAYAQAVRTLRTRQAIADINAGIASLEAQSDEIKDPATRIEQLGQIQTLRQARSAQRDTTQVIQPARPPSSPVSPHPRRNAALAGVLALLLGFGVVAVAERLDRRLRDPNQLEPLLGAPLLSQIPKSAFPGGEPGQAPVAEAFRTLAASLVYFNVDRRLGSVMVVSPTKGDGKTTVATHLAIALARDGQNVILVDCDLRRPQVSRRLGVEPSSGLTEVLTGQAGLDTSLVEVKVGGGRLQALGGGKPPPNPALLLGSARMESLLVELSERADIVVLDSPPLLNVSDAVALLERVSGSIVVARLGQTESDAIDRLRQVVESARGMIFGGVATGSEAAGFYGYGMEYRYGEDVDEAAPPVPAGDGVAPETLAPRVTSKRPGVEARGPGRGG
jgi:capsular exopolysaccharide synthesis family protein